MLIYLSPSDPRPIYQQIVDEIRRAVVLGTLSPGDPLPSVRQLAGELRVNPNTVQQAYRELERTGVVFVRRGQGSFVAAPVGGSERDNLLRDLAARTLHEARRYGLEAEELIRAIRSAAGEPSLQPSSRE